MEKGVGLGRWMARMVAGTLGVVVLAIGSVALAAQTPEMLTLDEAIRIAKANNPGFLGTANDVSTGRWQVREAYGNLLPTVSASGSASYSEGGRQRIGTLDFGTQETDWYSSGYGVSLSWGLNGSTIFGIPNARANQRATEARVAAAAFNLESLVAFQYMLVLRSQSALEVAERQLRRATQNHSLVTSRVRSGAAAGTEAKQAEVDVGRAEVGVINAERDLRQARLLLGEQLGGPLSAETNLSSEFSVFEPEFALEDLLAMAVTSHPSLGAANAQEQASRAAARQVATSQYLPSISLSTSIRGNTLQALNEDFLIASAESSAAGRRSECEFWNQLNAGLTQPLDGYPRDCSAIVVTDADRAQILAGNDVFPFKFDRLPVSVGFSVSVPIFTGFSRQRQVAQARVAADDAAYAVQTEELRLRTAVTNAYDNLESAFRVVTVEERNQAVAEEQLQLQQRRYALGAAPLLELLDAQTITASADQAYLGAVYDFHYSLIALEAAVGQSLGTR